MTKIINTVLVGASGQAGFYIKFFRETAEPGARLCAVVDPFVSSSPHLDWIRENNIPVFDRLEDFYASGCPAELVIISSPIQFHRQQAETAMFHGSAVLCEKPLCADVADAVALRDFQAKSGLPFGVAFQWSFSETMASLKRDILDGVYGAPLSMKTFLSWPRGDAYYDPAGWKGKRRDRHGNAINDSIVMNAAAHYLHNILFLLGSDMESAAYPASVTGSLYRARDIESFDTCFMKGAFRGGCSFLYCVSHSAEKRVDPRFEYRFERGTVSFDDNIDGIVRGVLHDGSVREYGAPRSEEMERCEVYAMIESARTGAKPVCGISTVMPHLTVCEAILDEFETGTFPQELLARRESPAGVYVKGLNDVMEYYYEHGQTPDAAAWTVPERTVTITGDA